MDFINIKKYSKSWKILLILVAIVTIGVTSSIYTVRYADRTFKKSLLVRTIIISNLFDGQKIKSLSGTIDDLNNYNYPEIKRNLRRITESNDDLRFAYLSGISNGDIFFYADSEIDGSDDSSPPGQKYPEATKLFKDIFTNKISNIEGPVKDRWGSWISALSPILDRETGEVIAVIGLDINAKNYYINLFIYGSIPILITILFINLIFFVYRERKRDQDSISFKSELMSIAAHDLKTPIVGIRWSLDSIIDSSKNLDVDDRRTLELIREASVELLDTTDEILESFKIRNQTRTTLNKKEFGLAQMFEEINILFAIPAKEKSISIFINNIPKDLYINGDHAKIKRSFSNLISNAIKYSPNGKNIDISLSETDHSVVVSVKDYGIGIPENERANMFQEYYRTKQAVKTSYGTGLGLYYVKKIIELHNGKVWFESKENEGTIFFVEIPKK